MKRTLVNMALTAAVVVAGMAPQSEAVANQVVQIGAATTRMNYLPYMEYYAFGRTATLYSEKEIAANGGGPGRITRVEWFSDGFLDYGSFVYDYGGFDDKRPGKEVELYMGTRASEQFPVNMYTTFSAALNGQAPMSLQNVEKVYVGKGFDGSFTGWRPLELTEPYTYTGGNLVILFKYKHQQYLYPFTSEYDGSRWIYRYPLGYWRYTNAPYTAHLWWGYDWNGEAYWNDTDQGAPWYHQYRANVRLTIQQGIERSFPDDVDPRRIVRAGEIYNTRQRREVTSNPAPYLEFRETAGRPYKFKYRIEGPFPSREVVYQALDPKTGSTTIDYTGTMTGERTMFFDRAEGPFSGSVKDGRLDLNGAQGGSYRVFAEMTIDSYTQQWVKDFIMSYNNDIAIREAVSPLSDQAPRFFKYPQDVEVPIACRVQNVGINNVTDFRVIARTYSPSNVLLKEETKTFNNMNLQTGDTWLVEFSPLTNTNAIGQYRTCFEVQMINVTDQGTTNNQTCQTFQVAYNVEVAANTILNPVSTADYYANRPIVPVGSFVNKGILDLSNVPVRMVIKNSNGVEVYNRTATIESLPTGEVVTFVEFPAFTPTATGQYTAEMCCTYSQSVDPVQTNNCTQSAFFVGDQLAGTYRVGANQDYPTIQAAVNDLYKRGVRAPVTFELTDNNYTVGSSSARYALDLSSRIVGVNETNTVTFRPNQTLAALSRSVTLTLRSNSGVGIFIGQSAIANQFGVQSQIPSRENANSTGFIRFDGGEKKSLVLAVESSSQHRAAVYFGRGASNNAVRNCWIENSSASTPSYTTSLPRQIVSSNLTFRYEDDLRIINNQPVTYSAGVVNRNTVPVNQTTGNNDDRLDTLNNQNNVIEGNVINGFGYGVVSIGNGVLYSNQAQTTRAYYNVGTKITGNRIENVARAGVYAGYEDGVEISGNYIANVGGVSNYSGEAAGIMLGYTGDRYHNVRARVNGNEISNVSSPSYAAGVALTQNANRYQIQSLLTYPSGNTDNRTWNNIVRGVTGRSSSARVAGIHYLTGRFVSTTGVADMNRAQFDDVWTTGDKVYNNTIVLAPGSVSLSNGMVVGIGFEQSRAASVENNAIALQYPSLSGNAVQSFLLWHGAVTGNNGIQSNNNAFWTPSTNGVPNSAFAMLVETTPSNEQIAVSDMNRFRTILQWRTLVKQDQHSVFGDFVSDHAVVEGKLRLKSNPTPIGSILNNRGTRLESVVTDLDGKVRGESQQLYDIGAVEFNGRFYLNDIESEEITQPRAYRALSGAAADAEHVMGQPLNVIKANIRNSGSLPQTNVELVAEVFIEQANGQYSAVAAASATKRVSLLDGQRQEVEFVLNNFTPKTYAELANYTVPSRFAAMSQNVTPKYRVVVRSANDQNSSNNIFSKEVRYWVKRSKTGIVVSVSGTSGAIGSSFDLATRLNSDTLLGAMRQLQWSYSNGDYDVIDRGAWESEAFDYSPYSFVFWSQGRSSTGSGLSRTQRDDIRRYLASGSIQSKKNLLIASEEIARAHTVPNAVNDGFFVNRVLRARLVTTPQNTPKAPSYHNFQIEGVRVASTYRELVKETGVTINGFDDITPRPALLQMYSDSETEGLAQPAYKYLSLDAGVTVNTMGTAVSAPMHNIVYYGMDWRHAGRMVGDDQSGAQRMLLGALDYFKSNGGVVLPVELSSFAAEKASDRSVSVRWVTSSEQNTDRFEVERSEDGTTYRSVGSVAAAGTSTETRVYGHVDSDIRPVVYQYRLRMIDRDGSEAYSVSVEVDMRDAENVGALVSPNPSTGDYATVSYRTSLTGDVNLRIVGTDGRDVVTESLGRLTSGDHEYRLSTTGLSSGSYVVRISVDGKEQGTTILKVVK